MATLTHTDAHNDQMSELLPRTRGLTTYVLVSGVLAGLLMTVLMWAARMFNWTDVSAERIFGTLLLGYDGASPWIVGLMVHLALSGIVALAYAEVFRRVGFASASFGAALGVIHWNIVGVFLGILPYFHPMMPLSMPAPGWFGVNDGIFGFVFLLLLHVMFGAIMGDSYRRVLRERKIRR